MTHNDNIGIVIVCFNPKQSDLQAISAIATKYKGAVVDNSSCANTTADHIGRMAYIPLMDNKGIAEAQNVGIKQLLQDSSIEYIVFLDQDSRVDTDYPSDIVGEYQRLQRIKPNLATLGPTVDNIQTGEEYRSVIHKDQIEEEGFVERKEIISSGSVMSRRVINDVGMNDASLFIDFVDFEWCWRARSKGYVCGITRNVHICHQVGSRELSFGSYKVIISSPVRYYYQYRNHLVLCRRGYVPLQWKIANAVKHQARLFYFPILVSGGCKCWKYMCKGIGASFLNK